MALPQLLTFQGDEMLEGVARQVTADSNRIFAKERHERTTIVDERVRLARELHDGLLQSLTAASLQLKALSRVVDKNPHAASRRLRDIEEMITEEQRELRLWIDALKPGPNVAMASKTDIAVALDKLCRRVESQFSMRILFMATAQAPVPRLLADEIYRLAQEGLSNVGRHARAGTARVDIDISPVRVFLLVADDGHGFPFCGRYDLATLNSRGIGPASLKERVGSLGGDLLLTSATTGSNLEIILPLHRPTRP